MKLRPEGCKVLVEVERVSEKVGRILVPKTVRDNHQHTMTIGTVVAIGPGATCNFFVDGSELPDDDELNSRELREGDKIWFSKYGGRSFEFTERDKRDVDLRIINDEDVMAIIDDYEEE